jgi:hypothetical protein
MAQKRWYMEHETFLAFRDMQRDYEKRMRLDELSQDAFTAVLVKHKNAILDVIVNSEVVTPETAENEGMA